MTELNVFVSIGFLFKCNFSLNANMKVSLQFQNHFTVSRLELFQNFLTLTSV